MSTRRIAMMGVPYHNRLLTDEGTGRTDEALSVGLDRRSGRGLHHTLGRIFNSIPATNRAGICGGLSPKDPAAGRALASHTASRAILFSVDRHSNPNRVDTGRRWKATGPYLRWRRKARPLLVAGSECGDRAGVNSLRRHVCQDSPQDCSQAFELLRCVGLRHVEHDGASAWNEHRRRIREEGPENEA